MATEIKAPMAGKVVSLLVSEGDAVEEDQDVVMLEAMKMETSVYAETGGKVIEIKVTPGASVEEDDVLMIIE